MEIKNYKTIRSRRRSIALEITKEGGLLVRAPYAIDKNYIARLVAEKADWVFRKIQAILEKKKMFQKKEFVEGEEFFYLGEKYKLRMIDGQCFPLDFQGEFLLSKKYKAEAKKVFADWYGKMAREKIIQRVKFYAGLTGLRHQKIKITGAEKRWGSCSFKNNLNFSRRLIMAPVEVVDYVVLHEIIHIAEKNHSKRFWGNVRIFMPDYKERRKWLRKNSHLFSI